jgi:hypothetical protein
MLQESCTLVQPGLTALVLIILGLPQDTADFCIVAAIR